MTDRDPAAAPITLEQWCRALAAHAVVTAHPDKLHEFTAPETIEWAARFIHRMALGEAFERPPPRED